MLDHLCHSCDTSAVVSRYFKMSFHHNDLNINLFVKTPGDIIRGQFGTHKFWNPDLAPHEGHMQGMIPSFNNKISKEQVILSCGELVLKIFYVTP